MTDSAPERTRPEYGSADAEPEGGGSAFYPPRQGAAKGRKVTEIVAPQCRTGDSTMSGLKQIRMEFDAWRIRMQGKRARFASTFHEENEENIEDRVSVSVEEALDRFVKRHQTSEPEKDALYKHLCDRSQFGEGQKWQFDRAIWEQEKADLSARKTDAR